MQASLYLSTALEEFPDVIPLVVRKYNIILPPSMEVTTFAISTGRLELYIPGQRVRTPVGFWGLLGTPEGYHQVLIFDEVIARILLQLVDPARSMRSNWKDLP